MRERLLDESRLRVLRDLDLLDGPEDGDFDRLARLAAGLFGAETGAVVLVDAEREWYAGVNAEMERRRSAGFASRVVAADEPYVVAGGDNVDGKSFRAGAPIIVDQQRIGALIATDAGFAGTPPQDSLTQLVDLAAMATAVIELKREARVRARTAAELIREEWRHALTLEAGHVGSWVWDIPTGNMTCNDIFRRMFRMDPARPIKVDALFDEIDPAFLPEVEDGLNRTFEDGVDFTSEFRLKSGRWLSSRGRVYQRNAADRPLVMMGMAIDITEAREAADHTRHLLRELNHRVKNTLAMTQSIARQTLRYSADPQSFIDTFSGRIRTLADAHELLADRDWAGVGLVELVQSQVKAYAPPEAARLTIRGDDMQLPPDQALGLGIVLHELASNAARYGAFSVAGGHVRIEWSLDGEVLHLDWQEGGGPSIVGKPVRGFGTRLIERSLDKVLGSEVRFELPAEGVHAHITLPITDQSSL